MRDPRTPDCAIKACHRAAGRGGLCARHKKLVPYEMVAACIVECISIEHKIARRHHRKWQRHVQALVNQGAAA